MTSGKAPGGEALTLAQKRRARNRNMTPGQRALRDTAIVAALNASRTLKDVAREWGLSQQGVEKIQREFNPRSSAFDQSPEVILRGLIAAYERQMHDFAMVAEDTLERAPAVAIAAMKGRSDALERYTDLLTKVGKLPADLELFRTMGEFRHLLNELMDRLDRFEDGEVTAAEVADFLRDVAEGRRPLYEDAVDAPALGDGS